MIELLYFAYGVFMGGVSVLIFQTQRKINAYDRHRKWCDQEWKEHWEKEQNSARRHEWATRHLIYLEGWRNGMSMDTDGPKDWWF